MGQRRYTKWSGHYPPGSPAEWIAEGHVTCHIQCHGGCGRSVDVRLDADSDDLARVYRFDLAQDSEMISPTIPI